MDLFDYCNYESDSFPDYAPPPDFRVQRTPWTVGSIIRVKAGSYFAAGRTKSRMSELA